MAPKMAEPQPLIIKFDKNFADSFKIIAFTTKVKKPKVKKLIGSVRNKSIGRKSILKKPIITTAHIAVPKDFIVNEGTISAVI